MTKKNDSPAIEQGWQQKSEGKGYLLSKPDFSDRILTDHIAFVIVGQFLRDSSVRFDEISAYSLLDLFVDSAVLHG